jgi:hypothetical protein
LRLHNPVRINKVLTIVLEINLNMVISTRGEDPCFQGNLSLKWDILFTCFMMVKNTNNVQVYDKGSPIELKNISLEELKTLQGVVDCWGDCLCKTWEGHNLYIYHVEQKHFNTTLISTATSEDKIRVQIRHYSPKDQSFDMQPWHSKR